MKATRRSSPPRSRAIAVIPDAPPATMPSAAVGRSRSVTRAVMTPTAREMASVAALTSATGSQSSPSAPSDEDFR
jgi:hypothetical protein